jgi:hypothetical protein
MGAANLLLWKPQIALSMRHLTPPTAPGTERWKAEIEGHDRITFGVLHIATW